MHNRQQVAEKLALQSSQWYQQGRACHPEPGEIRKMIEALRWVLLPNFFQPAEPISAEACINKLHSLLSEQIYRASFQRCLEQFNTAESITTSDELADKILQKLPAVQQLLHEDVMETYNGDPAASGYDEVILTYPGLFALMVYRVAHVVWNLEIPLLPRMMTEYAHSVTGIDIHPGATLGRGIMIDHGTGIVIGETTLVGNHVRIYQGVTLGALFFPRDEQGFMVRKTKRHPTVEDSVVLYANATVLGGETVIGHDSVIGSNAWLTASVPPYSKVLYQTESVVHQRSV